MNRIRIDAPAKINLRLTVLSREVSGFHVLETLFCGISLADHIELARSRPGIALDVEGGIDTGPAEQNLAVMAARAFHERTGIPPAISIRLDKRIPAAAGLGGGSSDAAASLIGLNELHDRPLSPAELLEVGAGLGSDVPFFLTGSPFALAWGRGERLLELVPPPPRSVLIGHPGVAIPTPATFAELARIRERSPRPTTGFAVSAGTISDWETIERLAVNDLEEAARARFPGLDAAKRVLIDAGATLALLAGSGSAIFGIFTSERSAQAAEPRLHELGLATWRARSLEQWPEPRPVA